MNPLLGTTRARAPSAQIEIAQSIWRACGRRHPLRTGETCQKHRTECRACPLHSPGDARLETQAQAADGRRLSHAALRVPDLLRAAVRPTQINLASCGGSRQMHTDRWPRVVHRSRRRSTSAPYGRWFRGCGLVDLCTSAPEIQGMRWSHSGSLRPPRM